MPKALFFHGGGPTAVLNASLAGAVRTLQEKNVETFFAPNGIASVLSDRVLPLPLLTDSGIERLKRTPGSAIGSGRDHLEDSDYALIASRLSEKGFSIVIGAGGNGTMDTVRKLAAKGKDSGLVTTGIPKTMDNDLSITDHSPGFLSAARYMISSVREAMIDVHSLPIHAVVIECFGRNAGWLTASTALAGTKEAEGPDLILLPETAWDEQDFLNRVEGIFSKKTSAVIVASEGLKDREGKPIVRPVFTSGRSVYFGDVSAHLSQCITKNLGIKSRSEKPGILSRSSIMYQSVRDRKEAFLCGCESAKAAMAGLNSSMSIIVRTDNDPYRSRIDVVPITDEILAERCMDDSFVTKDGSLTSGFFEYMRPMIEDEIRTDFLTFV